MPRFFNRPRQTLRSLSTKGLLMGLIVLSHGSRQTAEAQDTLSLGDLLDAGQVLWDELAPKELKENYRLPTLEEVETLLAGVETALADGNAQSLAAYADEARFAMHALRGFEGGDALVDWLEPRIDFLTAAEEIQNTPRQRQAPTAPGNKPVVKVEPQYTQEYWNSKLSNRALPKQATRYMPIFKKAFEAKGIPTELAWLSEVESSINLKAKSPVGAYGPFQFMPATAERFGLKVGSPDERSNPYKSAEAAASYLKILYKQFNSWPLALAAYNAGEGRVGRTLKKTETSTFDEVSPHLPTETRMYVPKIFATIAKRESMDVQHLITHLENTTLVENYFAAR